jgi:hypothetical protein
MTTIPRGMDRAACEREAQHCARMAADADRKAVTCSARVADILRNGARNWRRREIAYREAAEDGRA